MFVLLSIKPLILIKDFLVVVVVVVFRDASREISFGWIFERADLRSLSNRAARDSRFDDDVRRKIIKYARYITGGSASGPLATSNLLSVKLSS